MDRHVEHGASSGNVVGVSHDHGQVAVEPTTTSGRNGTSVGKQLTLQNLQRRVGGLSVDRCQRFVRKREFG